MTRWLEGIPPNIREPLASYDLLDVRAEERRQTGAQPISSLLERWADVIRGRGRTHGHVEHTFRRARSLFTAAGIYTLDDLDPERVERALRELRESKGWSFSTSNASLRAARSFSRWAWTSRLIVEDPLRGLRPLNARLDRRRERMPFSVEEARRLFGATELEPVRCGLSGRQRALLYRLAIESGLRASELRSLRVASFEGLSGETPVVRLQASHSKHRREDVIALRPELARVLEPYLCGRMPQASAFSLPAAWRSAEMLREDLAAAEIPYRDPSGGVRDFHSFRVTTATLGARAGIAPATLQRVMRHATAELTFATYAKLDSNDERVALSKLPDLTPSTAGLTASSIAACGGGAGDTRGQAGAMDCKANVQDASSSPAPAARR